MKTAKVSAVYEGDRSREAAMQARARRSGFKANGRAHHHRSLVPPLKRVTTRSMMRIMQEEELQQLCKIKDDKLVDVEVIADPEDIIVDVPEPKVDSVVVVEPQDGAENGSGVAENGLEIGGGVAEKGVEIGGGVVENGVEIGGGVAENGIEGVVVEGIAGGGVVENGTEGVVVEGVAGGGVAGSAVFGGVGAGEEVWWEDGPLGWSYEDEWMYTGNWRNGRPNWEVMDFGDAMLGNEDDWNEEIWNLWDFNNNKNNADIPPPNL